jgi:hypothetical protein
MNDLVVIGTTEETAQRVRLLAARFSPAEPVTSMTTWFVSPM